MLQVLYWRRFGRDVSGWRGELRVMMMRRRRKMEEESRKRLIRLVTDAVVLNQYIMKRGLFIISVVLFFFLEIS